MEGVDLYGGRRFFLNTLKWGGGQNYIPLWNFGNLTLKWRRGRAIHQIGGGGQTIFRVACYSKKFGLPYYLVYPT